MAEFSFVHQTGPKSQRDAHLELSEIRSHNTKRLHKRRREEAQSKRLTSRTRTPSSTRPSPERQSTLVDQHPPQQWSTPQSALVAVHHDPIQHLSGSGDPFNSISGLQVTPEVNHFISLIREKYLAPLYTPPIVLRWGRIKSFGVRQLNDVTIPGARQVQRDMNIAFKYSKTASGWLFCAMSGLLHLFPASETEAAKRVLSQCRAESYRVLREEIAKEGRLNPTNVSLLIQIVYMFKAGIMERQPENALVHTWALQKLVEIKDADLSAQLFMILLHNDVEFSLRLMRPTLLDFSGWITEKLESVWTVTELRLPDIGSAYQAVHPSIQDHPLAYNSMIRVRRGIAFSTPQTGLDFKNATDLQIAELMYNWTANRTHHDTGLLLNHFLAFMEECEFGKVGNAATRFIDAALTLTAIYTIRAYLQRATINGIDVRDKSYALAPRLKTMLQTALQQMTIEEQEHYEEACFWMFFSGAHYEESVRRGLCAAGMPLTENYFSQRLASSAREMGLTRWKDARMVLEEFVYDDFLTPSPEEWYEQIVGQFSRDYRTEMAQVELPFMRG